MDNRKVYDCIIIGGGISGLSFAHYLTKENQDILIIEKEKEIGGQIETQKSKDTGFWNELGAHTCYNSYSNLLGVVKDLGFESQLQKASKLSYVIYSEDKIKGILSHISLLPIALRFLRVFFAKKQGKTVKEYFKAIVGRSNYNPLFSNLFRAVISQNADNYPAEIFLKKRAIKLKEFPRKFTFKEGLQSFLDMIVEGNKIQIKFDTDVKSISSADNIFTIATESTKYYARNIAIATDVKTASELTRVIHPEISEYLSDIELSKSETLNIVTTKEAIDLKKIAGIIPLSNDFTSVVSRDIIDDPTYRGMTFHFAENINTREEKIDVIRKVLNINTDDILFESYSNHILPSLKLKNVDLNKQAGNVADSNIFMLGNYYFGLSLEDCVHRSKVEYERYMINNIQNQ